MRNKKLIYIMAAVILLAFGFSAGSISAAGLKALAGNLDSPGPPGTTMSFSLEDIYQRLDKGANGAQEAFKEPSSGPTSGTGHTLNQVMAKAPVKDNADGAQKGQVLVGKKFWGLTGGQWGPQTGTMPNNGATILTPTRTNVAIPMGYHNGAGYVAPIYPPAPVAATEASTKILDGDDADLGKGVPWPVPRFTDNGDGTVTDELTGLIWLADASCDDFGTTGYGSWATAISAANNLYDVTPEPSTGDCSLTDGSSQGEWRLPNARELESLLHYGTKDPALPGPNPFVDLKKSWYWTSTKYEPDATDTWLWVINLYDGERHSHLNSGNYYIWAVRDP